MISNVVERIAAEVSLVLSVIVLIFWVAYSLIITQQIKQGTARKDWKISMVFYAGIMLLVLATVLMGASMLYDTAEGEQLSAILNSISMIIFIYGFYLRMQSVLPADGILQPKKKKR